MFCARGRKKRGKGKQEKESVRLNFDAEVQEEAYNFNTGIHEGRD